MHHFCEYMKIIQTIKLIIQTPFIIRSYRISKQFLTANKHFIFSKFPMIEIMEIKWLQKEIFTFKRSALHYALRALPCFTIGD